MKDISRNLTMLCDFYELTMSNGYFACGFKDKITYFDVFYRSNPDNGGYAVVAGLEQVVEYINNLHFDEQDIQYLRDKNCFSEEFLDYLRNFKFTGDIWAVPEGTVVFPGEPLMTVRAKAIEAQFIETYVLMMINHQSLIATKAARLARAAKEDPSASLAPDVRRAATLPFSVRVLRISAARPLRLAPFRISLTVFPRPVLWRIPGCRCLIPNTMRSRPIARFILITQRC